MHQPLSDALRTRIISDMLNGVGRNDTVRTLQRFRKGLSGETVSRIRDEFDNDAVQHGVDWAGRKFNVSPLVAQLVAIGEAGRTNKVDLAEMIGGVKVAGTMKDSGIEPKELQSFVTNVYQRAKLKNYSVEDIIIGCAEIEALEEKYGKTFEDLKKEWTEMGFKLPQMRKALDVAGDELEKTKKRSSELFAKSETDRKGLEGFNRTKQSLHKFGLDIEDLEKTNQVLVNLKKQKFRTPVIIAKFNTEESLDESIEKKRKELRKANSDLVEVNQDLKEIRGELGGSKAELDEARKLERTGLSVERIAKLRAFVVKTSVARGTPPKEAWAFFEKEVEERYDRILGFEVGEKHLRETVNELGSDIDTAKKELEKTQKKNAELTLANSKEEQEGVRLHGQVEGEKQTLAVAKETKDALALLKRSGAEDPLLAAKTLAELERVGEAQKVVSLVGEYGDLGNAIQTRKDELKVVEDEVSESRRTIESLGKDKTKVDEDIARANDELNPLRVELKEKPGELIRLNTTISDLNKEIESKQDELEKGEEAEKVLRARLLQIDAQTKEYQPIKNVIALLIDKEPIDRKALLQTADFVLERTEESLRRLILPNSYGPRTLLAKIRGVRQGLQESKSFG